MTLKEKAGYLKDNHFSAWLEMHKRVEEEISSHQPMFCVCGKLATGFHEMNCKRFRNIVESETTKRLWDLTKTELLILKGGK